MNGGIRRQSRATEKIGTRDRKKRLYDKEEEAKKCVWGGGGGEEG